MTEAEWLACNDPDTMMEFVRKEATDRKWRLFLCACCRRMWPALRGIRGKRMDALQFCQEAVGLAEGIADGLLDVKDLDRAQISRKLIWSHASYQVAHVAHRLLDVSLVSDRPMRFGRSLSGHPASEGAEFARLVISAAAGDRAGAAAVARKQAATIEEKRYQTTLLRDLFNPFHALPPGKTGANRWRPWIAWNDACVPKLARSVYEEQAFDRLPVLADALEDAGCTEPALLPHLRSSGDHVRGCWAVDLILGRQ
jgi:hypothetical protein